ncbi:MAG: histidinol dehydrogenase [Candidatus Bathyarchaeota archaeon]
MAILQLNDLSIAEELVRKRHFYKMADDATLETQVKEIIREVQTKGDAALAFFTKKFDNVDLSAKGVKVSQEDILKAQTKVHKEELTALRLLKKRIEKIERRKLTLMSYIIKEKGLEVVQTLRPIESVGCYVPGGEAAYPSTLLMTTVPAKVAGVPRVVVCSPPTCEGEINPKILAAASICGIDEIYRLGGVQAIAALAYGTETVRPVAKIVGPGNKFVFLAKVIISKDVSIDLPAGPSEIVVLADETANPKLVALDLISQSEHTPDNIAGLVTTSGKLAAEVIKEVERLTSGLSNRREVVVESLSKNGFVFLYDTLDEAVAFVNAFAPEHLEIVTRRPRAIAEKITSAGIILLGRYTPVSASDYCVGTSHVLPTAGFSRIYSELSVFDYVKRVNIVQCSKEKLRKMKSLTKILAYCEGLPNHYLAMEGRFKDE